MDVRIFRIFPVSGLNRWFRKSDRPALGWPALGDRDTENTRIDFEKGLQRETPNNLDSLNIRCAKNNQEWFRRAKESEVRELPGQGPELVPEPHFLACTQNL